MKIRDTHIGDWINCEGSKYIKIDGAFMSTVKPILMGIDMNNFGRFYREDDFNKEVEFCPQWDYVNSHYKMSGFRLKSPGSSSYQLKLNEALDYFVLKDNEKDEIIMKRKYIDEEIYIVIWSKLPFRQGRVLPINNGNKNRFVDEYIEYHLDFEGDNCEEKG